MSSENAHLPHDPSPRELMARINFRRVVFARLKRTIEAALIPYIEDMRADGVALSAEVTQLPEHGASPVDWDSIGLEIRFRKVEL